MFITRTLLRWGLVGGLALGGLTLLVGPEYVSAGFHAVRGKAQGVVDGMVSDPVAMQRQLEVLAREYPERIAQVRGELAKVDLQINEYQRDIEIARRVVAMTSEHLGQLKDLVARAEESAQVEARPVAIRFGGSKFNIEEAYTEARRINSVRGTYQDRLATDQQQLTFLSQQRERLNEILAKLESEHASFEAQRWQLNRQIDAMQRNERLIALTEQQQETLANYEKFGKVGSLRQVEAKLAQIRTMQEAQLQALSKRGVATDYEKRAQYELSTQGSKDNPFVELDKQPAAEDQDVHGKPAPRNNRTLAFAEPLIIE